MLYDTKIAFYHCFRGYHKWLTLFVLYIHYNRSAKFSYRKTEQNDSTIYYRVTFVPQKNSKLHPAFDSPRLRLVIRVLIGLD